MVKRVKLTPRGKLKTVRKKGSGKGKGSAFERKVCKALSLWVSHGEHEDLFWRSAMSGGRATVAKKRGAKLSRHAGDISATSEAGHKLTDTYFIECKSYKDLAIAKFLLSGEGKLAEFWKVAFNEASSFDKIPLLIVHQNMMPTLVITLKSAHIATVGVSSTRVLYVRCGSSELKVLKFDDMLKMTYSPDLSKRKNRGMRLRLPVDFCEDE